MSEPKRLWGTNRTHVDPGASGLVHFKRGKRANEVKGGLGRWISRLFGQTGNCWEKALPVIVEMGKFNTHSNRASCFGTFCFGGLLL